MTSTSPSQACILVADDDFDTLKILSDFLTHHGYEVVTTANGDHALTLAEAFTLDLALIDVQMPGVSGLELTLKLKHLYPHIEVIIMTAYATVDAATEAIHQGAFHYLAKPLKMDKVLSVVENALIGWETRRISKVDLDRLSPRRKQVLQLMADGLSNRAIAEELDLAEKTIINYVSIILEILEVPNRTAAVQRARQLGLLEQ